MPVSSYGKVRPSTEHIFVDALLRSRKGVLWPQLWPEIIGLMTDGDRLSDTEREWLTEWRDQGGLGAEPLSSFQTVQFSKDWVRNILGGGNSTQERAIKALQEIGLLLLIHQGIKGHPSLYCVRPIEPKALSPPQNKTP